MRWVDPPISPPSPPPYDPIWEGTWECIVCGRGVEGEGPPVCCHDKDYEDGSFERPVCEDCCDGRQHLT